jgi:hypothetical protein
LVPIVFIALRTMLGFSPPEWAHVTEQHAYGRPPGGGAQSRPPHLHGTADGVAEKWQGDGRAPASDGDGRLRIAD